THSRLALPVVSPVSLTRLADPLSGTLALSPALPALSPATSLPILLPIPHTRPGVPPSLQMTTPHETFDKLKRRRGGGVKLAEEGLTPISPPCRLASLQRPSLWSQPRVHDRQMHRCLNLWPPPLMMFHHALPSPTEPPAYHPPPPVAPPPTGGHLLSLAFHPPHPCLYPSLPVLVTSSRTSHEQVTPHVGRASLAVGKHARYQGTFCISALYLMFVSPSPLATLSSPGPPHALPVLPPSRPPHALPDRPPLDRPSLALRPSLLSLVLSAPHVRPLLTLLTPAISSHPAFLSPFVSRPLGASRSRKTSYDMPGF
ncbi:hypothetical protein V8E53_008040, partial [Lactarius tabidus]